MSEIPGLDPQIQHLIDNCPYGRRKHTSGTTYWKRRDSLSAGEVELRYIIQAMWMESLTFAIFLDEIKMMLLIQGEPWNHPIIRAIENYNIDEEVLSWKIADFNLNTFHSPCISLCNKLNCNCSLTLMDPNWCYAFLRFLLEDLQKIYKRLNFPLTMKASNHSWYNCEEAFIITLFRIFSGMTFIGMAEHVFGGNPRSFSEMYNFVIRFLDEKGRGVVHGDSLRRLYLPHFDEYCDVIQRAIEQKYSIQLKEPNHIYGFIDCHCKETTTPGTGPSSIEINSSRHEKADVLQGAV